MRLRGSVPLVPFTLYTPSQTPERASPLLLGSILYVWGDLGPWIACACVAAAPWSPYTNTHGPRSHPSARQPLPLDGAPAERLPACLRASLPRRLFACLRASPPRRDRLTPSALRGCLTTLSSTARPQVRGRREFAPCAVGIPHHPFTGPVAGQLGGHKASPGRVTPAPPIHPSRGRP